jgi:hypothetical protein
MECKDVFCPYGDGKQCPHVSCIAEKEKDETPRAPDNKFSSYRRGE